jgi:acetate kinase
MKILVLNCGSSSIKYKLFYNQKETKSGLIEDVKNFRIEDIVDLNTIDAVGHRVVHGGEKFKEAIKITKDIIEDIRDLIPLAPLHNPSNLKYIEEIFNNYPTLPQVAIFDTAFHQTINKEHFLYPIPLKYYKNNNIRKYGFHGTSVQYIVKEFAKQKNKDIENINIIVLHLGNGASATLVKDGKSFDTSMGFTPLEGLMMGTRCGDIDPSIALFIQIEEDLNSNEVNNILNKQSGLKGICGTNDMRKIVQENNIKLQDKKELAFNMFCLKVQKYIGSYMIQVQNLDAIVFTGGIGENSTEVREKICKNIHKSVEIMVIPTNEELEIATQTYTKVI